jgi:hypothetical protein
VEAGCAQWAEEEAQRAASPVPSEPAASPEALLEAPLDAGSLQLLSSALRAVSLGAHVETVAMLDAQPALAALLGCPALYTLCEVDGAPAAALPEHDVLAALDDGCDIAAAARAAQAALERALAAEKEAAAAAAARSPGLFGGDRHEPFGSIGRLHPPAPTPALFYQSPRPRTRASRLAEARSCFDSELTAGSSGRFDTPGASDSRLRSFGSLTGASAASSPSATPLAGLAARSDSFCFLKALSATSTPRVGTPAGTPTLGYALDGSQTPPSLGLLEALPAMASMGAPASPLDELPAELSRDHSLMR